MLHQYQSRPLAIAILSLSAVTCFAGNPKARRLLPLQRPKTAVHSKDPFSDIVPVNSGPGVLVATPTHSAIDPAVAAFATGCTRWLNFTLGSQPQLGKTAAWEQVGAVCKELGKPNVDVTVAYGPALSNALGITHLVTSTVAGTSTQCSLKLSLYDAAAKRIIGTPIELAGTEDTVTRGLPGAARRILDLINMKSVPTPRIAENSNDLREIGLVPFCTGAAPIPQRFGPVLQMSNRSGAAGLLALTLKFYRIMPMNPPAAQQAMSAAPNSPILLYTVGREGQLPVGATIDGLKRSFPQNALLNGITANRYAQNYDWKAAETAAKQTLRCSPQSSPAWHMLGEMYGNEADVIRRGLGFAEMSSVQALQVAKIYPLSEAAQQRAVKLDPRNPEYQRSLSVAATFNGDPGTAGSALSVAIKLNPNNSDYYFWGLEIYQPKWYPNPAKMAEMAKGVAHCHYDNLFEADRVAGRLKEYGFPQAAKELYAHIGEEGKKQVARNPNDPDGHARIGDAADEIGDHNLALKEFGIAAALTPHSYFHQFMYARTLMAYGKDSEAIPILERILPLAPTVGDVYQSLGIAYDKTGKTDAAIATFNNGISIVASFEPTYYSLAETYSNHNNHKASLEAYLHDERVFGPTNSVLQCICVQQDLVGNYDAAIQAGQRALAHGGFELGYDAMIAPYYHKGDYNDAVSMAHHALALNSRDEYAYVWAGKALIKMGRKAQAMEEWREGLALKGPKAAEITRAIKEAN